MTGPLDRATWRKSARSTANGACVEIADNLPGIVGVRDSKDPEGAALVVTAGAFTAFVETVKAGQYT